MSPARITWLAAAIALTAAQPGSAQRIADLDWQSAQTEAVESRTQGLSSVRTALGEAADRIVNHVLSIDLVLESSPNRLPALAQESGGGSAASTLGTISGSLGPIANSLSMITRSEDPTESNGLSDGLAITGAGLAVLGGVLQVYSMTRGSDVGQQDMNAEHASVSDRRLRDQQRLGAGVLEDLERLLAEEGPGVSDAASWRSRADRALARADYVLRETRRELEELTSLLGQEAVRATRTGAYAEWSQARRALNTFPSVD